MATPQPAFRALTLSVLYVWTASSAGALYAGQRPALSEDAVQNAIRLGSQHIPKPYEMVWRTGEREDGITVMGAVYTPFLRVAMWAHERQKDQEDRALAVTDVPQELLSQTLTIALRRIATCCPAIEPGLPLRVYAVLVPAPGRHMLLCQEASSSPEAVIGASTDLSALRLFDLERANETSAILTVPLERVQSGWDIVYEMHHRSADAAEVLHFVGFGMIRDSDIVAWR